LHFIYDFQSTKCISAVDYMHKMSFSFIQHPSQPMFFRLVQRFVFCKIIPIRKTVLQQMTELILVHPNT